MNNTGRVMVVRNPRPAKTHVFLLNHHGGEGGKIDGRDQAQVMEGFDCQAEGLALTFFLSVQ